MSGSAGDRNGPGPSLSPAGPTPSGRVERLLRTTLWLSAAEGAFVIAGLVFGAVEPVGASIVRRAMVGAALALTTLLLGVSLKVQADARWRAQAAGWLTRLAADRRSLWWSAVVFYGLLFACLVALFGLSLRMNPGLPGLVETFLARGLLPLLWLPLLAFQAFVLLLLSSQAPLRVRLLPLAAGGAAVALMLIYWYGAEGQILRFNVDRRLTDQSAYLEYARILKDSGYTYPGDFNRMPVYPFLLSLVLRPQMTDEAFFLTAKYFNLFLSMLLLIPLAVLYFRRFDGLHALNLTLITMFTIFIYKAGWVQSELLFYVLSTVLFLLLWRLLEHPSYGAAVAAGLVAGAAHLTKASLWPGLLAFAVASLIRSAQELPPARRQGRSEGATWARSLIVLFVTGLVFLAVLSPYLATSRRISGRFFYNVNSTFYVWYDSWEEAEAGTKAHGDRLGWPALPDSEIPTLSKYLAEHTASQMAERLAAGARKVMDRVLHSTGYLDYLLIYGAALLVAAVARRRRTARLLAQHAPLALFLALYFGLYVLAYFWYAPIAAGDRLILALFLPLLVTLSSGLKAVLADQRLRLDGRSVGWLTLVNLLVLGMIVTDAVWAVGRGVYILRGGG